MATSFSGGGNNKLGTVINDVISHNKLGTVINDVISHNKLGTVINDVLSHNKLGTVINDVIFHNKLDMTSLMTVPSLLWDMTSLMTVPSLLWDMTSLMTVPSLLWDMTSLMTVPSLLSSDKVYQLLAHGRWFSPGTPVSSTTKTCRHDIAEILHVKLSYINYYKNIFININKVIYKCSPLIKITFTNIKQKGEHLQSLGVRRTS
jgi:hypothetical protein